MNETELLFTGILNCNRVSLYLNRHLRLDKDKSFLISSALKKRISCEPVQYILGKTEFMGLEFRVSPGIFIPRPETEILVETVINIAKSLESRIQSILDIGTGSGCIAISLAKFLPHANIAAIDISEKAIRIAQQNAILNNAKISFFLSDLFSNHELRTTNYDLIVSNPPYIPTTEIELLQPEIRYEPRIAIDGGKDGLYFYHKIINESARYLRKGGLLIMEMGFNQKYAIKNIFKNLANYKIIDVIKDYNNIDRVVVAKRYG